LRGKSKGKSQKSKVVVSGEPDLVLGTDDVELWVALAAGRYDHTVCFGE
jgi:hypothetical protein